ncbi:MAG: hypothetical protein ABIA78_02385 [archaeon]
MANKELVLMGLFFLDLFVIFYAVLMARLKVKLDVEYIKGQKKKLWGMQ